MNGGDVVSPSSWRSLVTCAATKDPLRSQPHKPIRSLTEVTTGSVWAESTAWRRNAARPSSADGTSSPGVASESPMKIGAISSPSGSSTNPKHSSRAYKSAGRHRIFAACAGSGGRQGLPADPRTRYPAARWAAGSRAQLPLRPGSADPRAAASRISRVSSADTQRSGSGTQPDSPADPRTRYPAVRWARGSRAQLPLRPGSADPRAAASRISRVSSADTRDPGVGPSRTRPGTPGPGIPRLRWSRRIPGSASSTARLCRVAGPRFH